MSIRPEENGKFPVVIQPFYGDVSLGNGTQYKIAVWTVPNGRLFVGVELTGCYTFGGWCHWSYAQEKLSLLEGDAKNMADFINSQLGHPLEFEGRTCQGEYDEKFLDDGDEGYF